MLITGMLLTSCFTIDGLRLTDLSWQELELGYEDKKTGTVVTLKDFKTQKATMTILLDRYSRQILSEDQAVEMLYANLTRYLQHMLGRCG